MITEGDDYHEFWYSIDGQEIHWADFGHIDWAEEFMDASGDSNDEIYEFMFQNKFVRGYFTGQRVALNAGKLMHAKRCLTFLLENEPRPFMSAMIEIGTPLNKDRTAFMLNDFDEMKMFSRTGAKPRRMFEGYVSAKLSQKHTHMINSFKEAARIAFSSGMEYVPIWWNPEENIMAISDNSAVHHSNMVYFMDSSLLPEPFEDDIIDHDLIEDMISYGWIRVKWTNRKDLIGQFCDLSINCDTVKQSRMTLEAILDSGVNVENVMIDAIDSNKYISLRGFDDIKNFIRYGIKRRMFEAIERVPLDLINKSVRTSNNFTDVSKFVTEDNSYSSIWCRSNSERIVFTSIVGVHHSNIAHVADPIIVEEPFTTDISNFDAIDAMLDAGWVRTSLSYRSDGFEVNLHMRKNKDGMNVLSRIINEGLPIKVALIEIPGNSNGYFYLDSPEKIYEYIKYGKLRRSTFETINKSTKDKPMSLKQKLNAILFNEGEEKVAESFMPDIEINRNGQRSKFSNGDRQRTFVPEITFGDVLNALARVEYTYLTFILDNDHAEVIMVPNRTKKTVTTGQVQNLMKNANLHNVGVTMHDSGIHINFTAYI